MKFLIRGFSSRTAVAPDGSFTGDARERCHRSVSLCAMAYRSFSHFLDELDRTSELIRVSEPVATELEITELADRQMKTPNGGKALLFEKPTINGRVSDFPVAINTMGSKR